MRILVINPGATSTKLAVFDGQGREAWRQTLEHSAGELAAFAHVLDQFPYRRDLVIGALRAAGYPPEEFTAVCGRGGLLRHIPSGTYLVTDAVIHDLEHPPYGEHASNLGAPLARAIAGLSHAPAYFVDPVSVDELAEVARVSGFAGMERQSFFHALNQKSVARRAADQLGKPYEQARLIVVHMGGGVSVAAHLGGKVVDMFNVKDEGSFSMDRGGSLPVNAVIEYCFSGKSKAEVKRILGYESGVYSYLGTRDLREVEAMCDRGDRQARLVFDALCYQLCKDVGAMASVLRFQVDAIALTGGMAHSRRMTDAIRHVVGGLAPVLLFPGEEEMAALAQGALRVLQGEAPKNYEEEAR